MIRINVIILILFTTIVAIFASDPEYQAPKKERFKQYIVGIKYLETASTLSQEGKVAYYKKLVEITGFTAETANTYADKYENTPENWLKLIESVVEMVNKPPEKEEKE